MRVVVISPNAAERVGLAELLRAEGHEVIATARPAEGLLAATSECPDAIIADTKIIALDGAQLVDEINRRCGRPRIILLCSRSSRCFSRANVICMTKPIDLAILLRHLQPRLEQRLA